MQHKHNPAPPPAIDERIASALGSADRSAAELTALIADAEAAAADADATAERERTAALDPAKLVDTTRAGAALAAANLTRDRMRAAIPRLQQLREQARSREYAARWALKLAEVEKQRDAVAAMLRDRYPALVGEIVAIMQHIAEADAAVHQINSSAPAGAKRLETVERHVRGALVQPDVWIAEQLRLPQLDRKGGPLLAWPPQHQVSVAAAGIAAVCAQAAGGYHPGANWQEVREKEEQRRRVL